MGIIYDAAKQIGGESVPIRGAVKSDTGRVRAKNEDAFGFFPESEFYVVADGMGGHAGGEIASTLAVETMRASLEKTKDEDLTPILDAQGQTSVTGRRLLIAVEQANQQLLAMSQQHPELTGMGTTVAALLVDDKNAQVSICHVGDSRVYRIRGNTIAQLTEDHSVVQQLLREGRIEPQELKTSPHRHILSRAVGAGPMVQPAIRTEKPQPGDIFLLCSDGVHGVVEAAELLGIVIQKESDLWRACDALVDLVNSRGGPDNGTVMILRYDDAQP